MAEDVSVTTSSKNDLFNTEEVAKIIGVTPRTLRYWNAKKIFEPYLIDHKGNFFYTREEVEQLKSVYHKDWHNPHKRRKDISPSFPQVKMSNVVSVSSDQNFKKLPIVQPHVIEMEKFVLGAMLLKNGEIIPVISNILFDFDFYRPEHRLLFNAITKIYNEGKPISLLTLFEDLRLNIDDNGKSLLDKIGHTYILGVVETAHTTAYAEHYARQIKEKSNYRQIQDLLDVVAEDIATEQPLNEVIGKIQLVADRFSSKFEEEHKNFSSFDDDFFDFKHDTEILRLFANRKTGFDNIDDKQLFLPGLYVLGATPACGKTTFAWQLANQIAALGVDVLFCTYEMTTTELYAKTAARELFKMNGDTTLTAADIRCGAFSKDLDDVFGNMKHNLKKLKVKKFANDDVDKLLFAVRPFCLYDSKPVIIVDYLQRLIPRNGKADTRTLIDDALFKIKDFQQKYNVTFIVISTFNRTNYNQLVSFESFKESGGIEYTADVVWAMQLNVANYLSGEKEFTIRQKINDAKKKQPREINLTCLKNRNGNNYDCYFQYFSAHDYFVPCDESDFVISEPDKNSKTDDNTNKNFEEIG